ncbi:hypothetical protein CCACVL1_00720, partial [Corchorus capsularis]
QLGVIECFWPEASKTPRPFFSSSSKS